MTNVNVGGVKNFRPKKIRLKSGGPRERQAVRWGNRMGVR